MDPPVDANALADALRHADPEVRRRAAMDMRKYAVDAAAALPALIEATRDGCPRVRREAVYALPTNERQLEHTLPVLLTALSDVEARHTAAWKLGQLGKPVVADLIAALHDEDRALAAAEALLKIGTSASEALPTLRELGKTSDPKLRKTVEAALKRIDR